MAQFSLNIVHKRGLKHHHFLEPCEILNQINHYTKENLFLFKKWTTTAADEGEWNRDKSGD